MNHSRRLITAWKAHVKKSYARIFANMVFHLQEDRRLLADCLAPQRGTTRAAFFR